MVVKGEVTVLILMRLVWYVDILLYIEKAELADVLAAGGARGAAGELASGRTQKDPVYVVVEEGM